MAIKKADAITAQSMLTQAQVAAAEDTIDKAIQQRYIPGQSLVLRYSDLIINDQVYTHIERLYTAGGWVVKKGWAGSHENGYSTLELS